MTRRPKRDPVAVGAALPRVLAELGHGDAARALRIAARWEEAVGPEVAAVAEPAGLRGGCLEVRVPSGAWAQHLQVRREELLAGLARALGREAPRDLRFRVG